MRPGIRALSGLLSRFTSLCRAICREVSDPLMRRVRALEPRMARLWDAIKALKAYIAQFGRRKRLSLRRKERIGDSRRIALAERGCAEVPPTRHVQPWAVPTPTPNAPLRKEVEREAGDPEGNLVIVERVARKLQHHFSCREYGWVGSAHRFGASTAWTDGTRKNG